MYKQKNQKQSEKEEKITFHHPKPGKLHSKFYFHCINSGNQGTWQKHFPFTSNLKSPSLENALILLSLYFITFIQFSYFATEYEPKLLHDPILPQGSVWVARLHRSIGSKNSNRCASRSCFINSFYHFKTGLQQPNRYIWNYGKHRCMLLLTFLLNVVQHYAIDRTFILALIWTYPFHMRKHSWKYKWEPWCTSRLHLRSFIIHLFYQWLAKYYWCKVVLYADVTALFYASYDPYELQTVLNNQLCKVSEWLQ